MPNTSTAPRLRRRARSWSTRARQRRDDAHLLEDLRPRRRCASAGPIARPPIADVLNRVRGPFNVVAPGPGRRRRGARGPGLHRAVARATTTRWLPLADRAAARARPRPSIPSVGNFVLVEFRPTRRRAPPRPARILKARGIIVRADGRLRPAALPAHHHRHRGGDAGRGRTRARRRSCRRAAWPNRRCFAAASALIGLGLIGSARSRASARAAQRARAARSSPAAPRAPGDPRQGARARASPIAVDDRRRREAVARRRSRRRSASPVGAYADAVGARSRRPRAGRHRHRRRLGQGRRCSATSRPHLPRRRASRPRPSGRRHRAFRPRRRLRRAVRGPLLHPDAARGHRPGGGRARSPTLWRAVGIDRRAHGRPSTTTGCWRSPRTCRT